MRRLRWRGQGATVPGIERVAAVDAPGQMVAVAATVPAHAPERVAAAAAATALTQIAAAAATVPAHETERLPMDALGQDPTAIFEIHPKIAVSRRDDVRPAPGVRERAEKRARERVFPRGPRGTRRSTAAPPADKSETRRFGRRGFGSAMALAYASNRGSARASRPADKSANDEGKGPVHGNAPLRAPWIRFGDRPRPCVESRFRAGVSSRMPTSSGVVRPRDDFPFDVCAARHSCAPVFRRGRLRENSPRKARTSVPLSSRSCAAVAHPHHGSANNDNGVHHRAWNVWKRCSRLQALDEELWRNFGW